METIREILMATDHIYCPIVGERMIVNSSGYEEHHSVAFYLQNDDVYVALKAKATTGTLYVKFTVTDSASATANAIADTTSATWEEFSGATRLDIDCSGLTAGEAVLKCESNGQGEFETYYYEQE